jgi:hypothetical protein
MTNPYRAMCAELLRSLENYPVQPSRDRDLCVRARALLAQPEPEGLSDEEIESEFRAWWNERYGSAYFGAVPLVSVIEWTQHVTARRPTPQPPADGELTVNLRMDLSSESLERLCDGLAAAVKPNGGYRALTTDDDISGEFIGEQQVGVEWWLPEHGCDSLENTLDSIKGRLFAAVRDWLPTAVISTSQPPADGEVAELVEWVRKDRQWLDLRRDVKDRILRIADLLQRQRPQPVAVSERPWERDGWCDDEGRCWMGDPGGGGFIPSWRLCRAEDAPSMKVSLPRNALPTPTPEAQP